MKISLIVAASTNQVIGRDGRLPWRLPEDLRYFKETTMGKPVVMGRATWESIGLPLPGRKNIVVTRQEGYEASGARVARSPEHALEIAGEVAELMVIGGGQIYDAFFPLVDTVYLTSVDASVDGDTYFPELDAEAWQLVSCESHLPDEDHEFAYEFRVYDRL